MPQAMTTIQLCAQCIARIPSTVLKHLITRYTTRSLHNKCRSNEQHFQNQLCQAFTTHTHALYHVSAPLWEIVRSFDLSKKLTAASVCHSIMLTHSWAKTSGIPGPCLSRLSPQSSQSGNTDIYLFSFSLDHIEYLFKR